MDASHQPAFVDQREYLVGGRLCRWEGPQEEVRAPLVADAPGAAGASVVIGRYPRLGEAEALAALDAAVRAYDNGRGAWPTMPVEERIAAVEKFAFRMREQRDRVVSLLVWEIGKSLPDSEREFDRTLQYIRDTIDALKELDRASSRFTVAEGILGQVRRAPLGVALCMGPFNYPLNETFTTLIPALIMGNTVVFKPAKFGVLLLQPLLEAFRDAFPPGVVNTVYGDGPTVISPLMASGRIDCLAFIGTARVADILKKQHPSPHRLRSVLGLGAKNPAIVLPDADLDLALSECVLGALSFNGQRCTAIKIMFVHDSIYDRFIAGLAERVDALRAGPAWEPGAQITPLPEVGKIEWLEGLVNDAVGRGAKVVNARGGEVRGSLFFPAVVGDVTKAMRLWEEEQFGPVVPVARFRDVTEPLEYVVSSIYGQQVSLFGRDPKAIGALIDPLVNQVSRVNLNSQCQRGPDIFPFTGRKDSAEGTLSVSDALRVFSIRALVTAKATDANKALVSTVLRERHSNWLSTDFVF